LQIVLEVLANDDAIKIIVQFINNLQTTKQ